MSNLSNSIKKAYFGLGWFWTPDKQFGSINGILKSSVGYAGGKKKNPTYYSIGDHTETIRLTYDETVITYEELLENFFLFHKPVRVAYSKQYRSVILYSSSEEKKLALEVKEKYEEKWGTEIYTDIEKLKTFYDGEDYHQKYSLQKNKGLVQHCFGTSKPTVEQLIDSTEAFKLNAYISGYGTLQQFESDTQEGLISNELPQEILDRIQRTLSPSSL